MIIKFIPETASEKKDFENRGIDDVTHYGVKEYMIFGNKMDDDGEIEDFHEWHGAYRYLIGSLNYFYEVINDRYLIGSLNYFYEVINDNRRGQQNSSPLRIVDNKTAKKVAPKTPMIKRGEIAPNITPLNIVDFAGAKVENDGGDDGDVKPLTLADFAKQDIDDET